MHDLVDIETRTCKGGTGTFTLKRVHANTRILEFTGTKVVREWVNQAQAIGDPDSFLQVAENTFISSSGKMDDYVNHSCEPNCGLEFVNGRVYLKSIKSIARGEELTFDYATSQKSFPFRFYCQCGNLDCRGEIGDFNELPERKKVFYRSLGVIAPYLNPGLKIAGKKTRARRIASRKARIGFTPAFAPER